MIDNDNDELLSPMGASCSNEAVIDAVSDIMDTLNDDECHVLLRIAQRLQLGQKQYGELDVATDKRVYLEEAVQEALDMSVYLACELEKLK